MRRSIGRSAWRVNCGLRPVLRMSSTARRYSLCGSRRHAALTSSVRVPAGPAAERGEDSGRGGEPLATSLLLSRNPPTRAVRLTAAPARLVVPCSRQPLAAVACAGLETGCPAVL